MSHPAEINSLDLELYFVTEVLKLDSLHYGYWENNEELTLANLRKAQTRYRETLINLIPVGVKTILDVGSGMGDLSKALAHKGYLVTALSPDRNHKKFYEGGVVDFHNIPFEAFQTSEKFDCIIMSESSGYFDFQMALPKCASLLSKDGYFINSGLFRKKDAKDLMSIPDVYEDYIAAASEAGLKKIEELDITPQTLPTLKLCWERYQEYFLPTAAMARLYMHESSPLKTKMLELLLSKQLKKITELQQFYEERLDPEKFVENARYLRIIFQRM